MSETSTKRVLLIIRGVGTSVMMIWCIWINAVQLSANCVNVLVVDCSDNFRLAMVVSRTASSASDEMS